MREYTLTCNRCQKVFPVNGNRWKRARCLKKQGKQNYYCSMNCQILSVNKIPALSANCFLCRKEFTRYSSELKKAKHSFCSRSCAAVYNNAHKTHGCRRSKLEVYLEKELSLFFPILEFHFNRRDAINGELDIYVPSLKLGFELNGIFHYEPIFGQDKLASTQNNDKRKFQACLEKGIELCIIDSSSLKYFKPANAQKYLDIIIEIIQKKMVGTQGFKPCSIP